jgi:hypothetical protein
MTATFIPVSTALRTLTAKGHTVQKLTRKQAMTMGRWDALYVVDGTRYDLAGIRLLAQQEADRSLERETTPTGPKAEREIDRLAAVFHAKTTAVIATGLGGRGLNGLVTYPVIKKPGARPVYMTVQQIRRDAKRLGLI